MPANVTPTSSRSRFSNGPPLLPGLSGASTCSASPIWRNRRPTADTMPEVTVLAREMSPGVPIAVIGSPGAGVAAVTALNT